MDAVLDTLKAIETAETFYQFVHKARHDETIRLVNDDVILMLISVEEVQKSEETGPEAQIQEPAQQQQDPLLRTLFWGIVAGVFAFFVEFIILLLIVTK